MTTHDPAAVVRYLLERFLLPQTALARLVGVSASAVRNWTRGAMPQPASWEKLLAMLDPSPAMRREICRERRNSRRGRPTTKKHVMTEGRREARDLLRAIRKAAGWRYEDACRKVAERLGCNPKTVRIWRQGGHAPQKRHVEALEDLLAEVQSTISPSS